MRKVPNQTITQTFLPYFDLGINTYCNMKINFECMHVCNRQRQYTFTAACYLEFPDSWHWPSPMFKTVLTGLL